MVVEYKKGAYCISTDKSLLDIGFLHAFLSQTYWSPGITKTLLQRKIDNSLCFGVYENKTPIGFARVITDFVSLAYLADVFIIETHRGRKLAKWLVESIIKHPDLQDLHHWLLKTRDAHGLYKQLGFVPAKDPERYMEFIMPSKANSL